MLLVLDLNLQQDGSIYHAPKESGAVAIRHPVIGLLDSIALQNFTQCLQSLRFDVVHLAQLTCS